MAKRIVFIFMLCTLSLSACRSTQVSEETTRNKAQTTKDTVSLKPISFAQVPGWQNDQHNEAWPALKHNCQRLASKDNWRAICQAAQQLPKPSAKEAKTFFQTWFSPFRIIGPNQQQTGLLTGYYVPLLEGSWQPKAQYIHPLYGIPDDLWRVNIGEHSLRGRLGDKVVLPYFTRAEIENNPHHLKGHELLWVNSAIDAFFLQVQGSGQIKMDSGETVLARFADHNGQEYQSIGKVLIDQGEIKKEDVSLFTIKQWLKNHPDRATQLMQQNPRYIFFQLDTEPKNVNRVVGSMNVPLTPQRSIAIDPVVLPLGSLIWIDTNLPNQANNTYQRLVFAQDTGAAIKNALRADLYWGKGKEAEAQAGVMQEPLGMILLKPKSQ